MKIVVCVHARPSASSDESDESVLANDEETAIEMAVGLLPDPTTRDVTALLAGQPEDAPVLNSALAAGATRALRLTGDDFAGADFHTLGQALGAAIKKLGADLVLTGARFDDEGLGAVPAAIARRLGLVFIGGVESVTATPAGDGGPAVEVAVRGGGYKRRLRVTLPAVLSVHATSGHSRGPSVGGPGGSKVELLPLTDPEATVVRRRTELVGKPEPAVRETKRVTSPAEMIAALRQRR